MSEYSLDRANFEKEKQQLKVLAEQPATHAELEKFDTSGKLSDFLSGGLLGLIDHKVTGVEMNELVTKLQSCFMEINEKSKKTDQMFRQVYETFDALDKGYIQGIVIGIKSAEKADQNAKKAQEDTVRVLQGTIDKLKGVKDELKRYAHLKDIDKIWDESKQMQNRLNSLSSAIHQCTDAQKKANAQIAGMSSFIDKEWAEIQKIKEDLSSQSSVISQFDSQEFGKELRELKNENTALRSKLKTTYIIAGCIAGLSVVQLLLNLIGIL